MLWLVNSCKISEETEWQIKSSRTVMSFCSSDKCSAKSVHFKITATYQHFAEDLSKFLFKILPPHRSQKSFERNAAKSLFQSVFSLSLLYRELFTRFSYLTKKIWTQCFDLININFELSCLKSLTIFLLRKWCLLSNSIWKEILFPTSSFLCLCL